MLKPSELEKENFERSVRGYNTDEVDAYVEYLKAQYEALYTEHVEYAKKLRFAATKLEEYKQKEEQINKLRLEARDIGNALIAKTKEKCSQMIAEADDYASKVKANADAELTAKKAEIAGLSDSVIAFRDKIFDMYGKHIESLQKMTEAADELSSEADKA